VLRWLKKRAGAHFAIVALFVIPMLGMLSIVPNDKQPLLSKIRLWFDGWEYLTVDSRVNFGRTAVASPQIVFLSIDAPSVALDMLDSQTIAASKPLSLMSNGYPFSREVYAEACDRLFAAGAKTVTFDLIFQKPFPHDDLFQKALDKYHDQTQFQ
jgi:CHASE2 domain-containing sensor protein